MEWTETRNLATSEGERAGPDHGSHGGGVPGVGNAWRGWAATGRKLEKPVCHYSLSWAKDETPDRQEMRWAAQEKPQGARGWRGTRRWSCLTGTGNRTCM